MRNKFVLVFINYLFKEKFIEDYRFPGKVPNLNSPFSISLGPKKIKKFYYPVEVQLKHDLIKGIESFSTPGKHKFMTAKKLLEFTISGSGAGGSVICLSARFKGLCSARQLIERGEGGVVVCVVRFYR